MADRHAPHATAPGRAPDRDGADVAPDALAGELRPRFLRISQAMRRETQRLDVTITQGAVLSLLRGGPLSVGELARAEGIRPPSMTQIVNRMVESGWVARTGPAVRGTRVRITEPGHAVWAEANDERVRLLAERAAALTAEERALLHAAVPALDKLFGAPVS